MDQGILAQSLLTFLAGILTFVAPCTFPLIPSYFAIISGHSVDDLKDSKAFSKLRLKIIFNAIAFVFGFSLVFILLGVLSSFLSSFVIGEYKSVLTKLAGLVVIVFGLFMLEIFELPLLNSTKRIQLPGFLKPGNPFSSFIVGFAFGFGWTPCVGPILSSVLALAATTGTVVQGTFLLVIYSLGLGVPFILSAALIGKFFKNKNSINKKMKFISKLGGALMIVLGIILITNSFSAIVAAIFKLTSFVGYENILKFL